MSFPQEGGEWFLSRYWRPLTILTFCASPTPLRRPTARLWIIDAVIFTIASVSGLFVCQCVCVCVCVCLTCRQRQSKILQRFYIGSFDWLLIPVIHKSKVDMLYSTTLFECARVNCESIMVRECVCMCAYLCVFGRHDWVCLCVGT